MSRLAGNITIDGLKYVGKTTVARHLARVCGCCILEAGLVFRALAEAWLSGNRPPEVATLRDLLTGSADAERLKSYSVTTVAQEIAESPVVRAAHAELVRGLAREVAPCIVVGRNTWNLVPGPVARIVLTADLSARVGRAAGDLSAAGLPPPALAAIDRDLWRSDALDLKKLPPPGEPGIHYVDNSNRELSIVVDEIVSLVIRRG